MQKNEQGLYEVEIDGFKYEFAKWGAEESSDTLLDLVVICGKPLGMGVSAFFGKDAEGESKLDKQIDPNVFGAIMGALTDGIGAHKSTIKNLLKKLTSGNGVFCEGKKVVYGPHYTDRLDHMFKVAKAGLEVQYGNFFGALLGASGYLDTIKKALTKQGQTMSNGASGAPLSPDSTP